MTNPHLHGFTHLLHLPPLGRRYLGLPLPLPAAVPAPPVPAPAPVPLLPITAPGPRLLLPVVSHRSETRQQMKPLLMTEESQGLAGVKRICVKFIKNITPFAQKTHKHQNAETELLTKSVEARHPSFHRFSTINRT